MGNCKAYAPHATAGPRQCRSGMDTVKPAELMGCRLIQVIRGGKGQNELLTVRRKIDEKMASQVLLPRMHVEISEKEASRGE